MKLLGRLASAAKGGGTVRGYVLSPDRRINVMPLELAGRVLWGRADDRGIPAWIAPATMRLVDGKPAVLVTTTSLAPLAGPEEPAAEAPGSLLARVFGERQAMIAGVQGAKLNRIQFNSVIALGLIVANVAIFLLFFYGRISSAVTGAIGGGG